MLHCAAALLRFCRDLSSIATANSPALRYRLSTRFNWYAAPLARALMGNLEETVLEFYRRHSESQTAGAA
jgi:hypothetical protein